MRGNRGQAAMEFLMTYGWAILAAVIVIAVLAAFGVFSPSTYIPNKCVLSAPLGCIAGTADSSGVRIEVRNGAGDTVTIRGVNVAGCTGAPFPTVPYDMPDQNVTTIVIPTCTGAVGSKFNGNIQVNYTKAGSTLQQSSNGQITDQI